MTKIAWLELVKNEIIAGRADRAIRYINEAILVLKCTEEDKNA